LAESTLNLKLSELEAEVGYYLGWGRGAGFDEPEWTDRQQREITGCVNRGLRSFYHPAPLPGERESYDWSFLRPFTSQTLEGDANPPIVLLPDDFGGMEGELRLFDSGRESMAIRVVPEALVRRKHEELPDTTGRPEVACVQVRRGTSTTRGVRYQLFFWPVADTDYTVQFQYYLAPDALTAAFPYAYGGPVHAETVLAAVKAAAEQHQLGTRGIEHEYFVERLRASVSLDRRNKAQLLGYNGDPGYRRGHPGRGRHWFNQDPITFNGVTP
jgi:hypothetical protein